MVPGMKLIRWHKRPWILARIFCIVLMAALCANPLLAALNTFANCDGRCCCCADTGHVPNTKISSTDMKTDCCDPTGSIPCRMAAGSMPDAPPLLIQTTQISPVGDIHLLLSRSIAARITQSYSLTISWADTGPEPHHPPIYLKICRLIC